ncbi:MAG: type II toxin-antitoxin system HipA family toxin [Pseudomonadota bacterium]
MTTLAEVRLWGRTIGAVALENGARIASFEYAPTFLGSGIELSPLLMPLQRRVYRFPELPQHTFHGLPGLLADSLPDRFGNALIDAWLASQGRAADSFNALERLCYIGQRGMGALEFAPVTGPETRESGAIEIDKLVALASEVLTQRQQLQGSLTGTRRDDALRDMLRVGTSAGGARAKAVIAWHPQTHEVRSGQVAADEGFEYWLLKFDGVGGNRDRELLDPQGYGLIEYAYALMAQAAGIHMSPCRLLSENGRHHFMTKRFDRTPGGAKLHMQSLGALAHFDYNAAGAHSYEQALLIIRQLGLEMLAIEEQFRRMAFNILARNQDDHVKNIAFLMDRSGHWSLAPAFDITWNYNPEGLWTANHQMTMNGRRDGFTMEDFRQCARTATMKRGRAESIVAEVRDVVARWQEFAQSAGVPEHWQRQIQQTLRL